MFELIDFPCCFMALSRPLCGMRDITTEIVCKEEVLIEEDHIGLNIEETESDLAMAEGFKFKRHTGF
jgi:hypothetical protein